MGGRKNAILLGVRQARKQRQHLGVPRVVFAQRLSGVADLALARQKHQHITLVGFAENFIDRMGHRILDVHRVIAVIEKMFGTVTHLHRIGASRHLYDRRVIKVFGKTLGVDGGRGDNDFQIGAPRHQLFDIAQQKIDVETAFVGFIDDDGVISREVAVTVGFREQNAVSHHLHQGVVGGLVVEADFVADRVLATLFQFLRQACGEGACGNAARLGAADHAVDAAAELQTDFRQLRGFARAGFPAHNHHLVVIDELGDLGAARGDRQGIVEIG